MAGTGSRQRRSPGRPRRAAYVVEKGLGRRVSLEMHSRTRPFVTNLEWAGFSAALETDDAGFQCVGKCPRSNDDG